MTEEEVVLSSKEPVRTIPVKSKAEGGGQAAVVSSTQKPTQEENNTEEEEEEEVLLSPKEPVRTIPVKSKAQEGGQAVQVPSEEPDKPTNPLKLDDPPKEREKKKTKTQGEENKEKKKRKRRRMEIGGLGYKRYVYMVLKQVHPEMGISSKAMTVLNNFMNDMFERLADEAARLSKYTGRKTMMSREIQGAVRLVLPGELGKNAVAEGTKAVSKYMSEVAKGGSKS
ncbi:hypothetical protein L1049_013908 [Liquidambar formosana]|uniref:Core Histone H2A/H2B/H3 domain-containing protein n=1 Tax=Liquidambar formosana TaxID=63359 RepID=A0AAP0RL54_LIQFO